MRTLATGILTFTLLLSGSAYAGGNPEDYPEPLSGDAALEATGTGTAAPNDEALQRQYEIQRQIEAEVFAKPQIPDAYLKDEPQPEPATIARAKPESECAAVFDWLASALGGECVRDSNFHNPSPVGYTTVYGTKDVQETKTVKQKTGKGWRGYIRAHHFRNYLKKKGYTATIHRNKHGYYKVIGSKIVVVQVPTVTRVRNDMGNDGTADTASDSNGMRGSDIDSGNW